MARRISRRWGLPFLGYKSSIDRHLIEPGYVSGPGDGTLTQGSVNFILDPNSQKFFRRGGASIVGSSSGLLETVIANATAKARQILEFDSPSSTDGYPTHLVLFNDESKRFTWLYWRSTNNSVDMNLAENFSATHYPTTLGTLGEYKYVPMPYVDNATGLTRGVAESTRRYFGQGSRSLVQMGSDLFAPGFTGTPLAWRGKRFNDQSGSGTEKEVVAPTGLIMPLWCPNVADADQPTASTTVLPWKAGDKFYYSLAFVNDAGEVSMPYLPGQGTTNTVAYSADWTDSFGLVTIPGANYRDYIRLKLAIGPPGTAKRLVLRSPKVNTGTSANLPNPYDLRISAVINNNTQVTFDDLNGDDDSLLVDATLVRLDRKWPYPARYAASFDQRHVTMYLNPPNPCAFVVCPTGAPSATLTHASRALNYAYDDANIAAAFFGIRVTAANVELCYTSNLGANPLAKVTIAIGSTVSLKSLLFAPASPTGNASINTTQGNISGWWAAQIVPGVDGEVTTDNLQPTYLQIVCSSTNGLAVVTTAASFALVSVGMRINGTNITDGTYVKSIESTTSLTMSAPNTGAIAGGTLDFWSDTGDADSLTATAAADARGVVRVYGNAWPAVIAFKKSYLDKFDPLKRELEYTAGGPGDAAFGGNSFIVGNARSVPASAGIGMGFAPLLDGGVSFYSRAWARLRNIRGGKTGLDEDYRNEVFMWNVGCISPYSIVSGNGWVGALTQEGFVVSDGLAHRNISGDIFSTDTRGDLAYEIGKCQDAASGDTDDYGCFAHVHGGQLWLSFRLSATQRTVMIYDFTASVEASGLAQVLKPDATPYGWSTPLLYNWRGLQSPATSFSGALGSVRVAGATKFLLADDTNDKTTCGLIQRIEDGTYVDGSDRVTGSLYCFTDLCESVSEKCSALRLHIMYRADSANESGVFYRLLSRSGGKTITLTSTGAVSYALVHIPLPLASRSVANQLELLLSALGGSGSGKVEYFGVECEVDMVPAMRTTGG